MLHGLKLLWSGLQLPSPTLRLNWLKIPVVLIKLCTLWDARHEQVQTLKALMEADKISDSSSTSRRTHKIPEDIQAQINILAVCHNSNEWSVSRFVASALCDVAGGVPILNLNSKSGRANREISLRNHTKETPKCPQSGLQWNRPGGDQETRNTRHEIRAPFPRKYCK